MIEQIETELGTADISTVKTKDALKVYLCPFCDGDIEIGEEHVVVVPQVKARLRRHCHTDCLHEVSQRNMRLKLHPNEPDVVGYYF